MSRSVRGEPEILEIVELTPTDHDPSPDGFTSEPGAPAGTVDLTESPGLRSDRAWRNQSPARVRAAVAVVAVVGAIVLAYALGFGMGRRTGSLALETARAVPSPSVVPMPSYPYSGDVYGDFGPCDRPAQTSTVVDLQSPAVRALKAHFPTYMASSLATSIYSDNGNVCSVNLQAVDQSGVTLQVIIDYSRDTPDRTSWSSSRTLGQYLSTYSRSDSQEGQRVRVMLSALSPQVLPKYPAVSSFANDPILLTQPG